MQPKTMKPGSSERFDDKAAMSDNSSEEGKMKISLYDPGMTHLHRVGLAGLYMALSSLNPEEFSKCGNWQLTPRSVEISWVENPKQMIEKLVKKTFLIKNGMVDFGTHQHSAIDDHGRVLFHNTILQTFLQHGQTRKIQTKEKPITIPFENKFVVYKISALNEYVHQTPEKFKLFQGNDQLQEDTKIAGWLYPGGVMRHVAHPVSSLSQNPDKFLCLLFAPIAALYYSISHKGNDGKRDKKKNAAIVLPHIHDLHQFSSAYKRYLRSPVQQLFANSMGDAGLMALVTLNIFQPEGNIQEMEIPSCSVIMMGMVGWSEKQKTRTGIAHFRHVDKGRLNQFYLALSLLQNRPYVTDNKSFYVLSSISRGLIAENIAAGRDWFSNFASLMRSAKLATIVLKERKGLNEMVKIIEWSNESDKMLVEAVHTAIRNRYGALAARTKQSGGSINFDKEFEKIRCGLMRSKNAQTFRATLADLFARGRINQNLQENWMKILPLFVGEDWQRARDLSLLALVSYAGKGSEEIEIISEEIEED